MAKKKNSETPDDFESTLQAYKLELKLVYEKSQDSFEKQLSYLSAGALGISILYIENVAKNIKECDLKWALILSWILLTMTLVANLISHYVASTSNFKSIQEIDEGNYDSDKITNRIKHVDYINVGTLVSFILGILLLVTFVIDNTMSKEIKTSPSPEIQKGRTASPPPQRDRPSPQTGQNPTAPPKTPSKPSK